MNTISINLNVPQGWHELDDAQLRYVYSLIAKEFAADEIKTLALLHFSGCKVIARHDKSSFLLKHGKDVFQTSGTQLAEVIPSLGWLDAIPASPVRLRKLLPLPNPKTLILGVAHFNNASVLISSAENSLAISE